MRSISLAGLCLLLVACDPIPPAPGSLTLLVAGGTIIDGTGSEGIVGDVGMIGDRIAWVGESGQAVAPDTIDANGLVVAPGFIDVHSHTSPQIAREEELARYDICLPSCGAFP